MISVQSPQLTVFRGAVPLWLWATYALVIVLAIFTGPTAILNAIVCSLWVLCLTIMILCMWTTKLIIGQGRIELRSLGLAGGGRVEQVKSVRWVRQGGFDSIVLSGPVPVGMGIFGRARVIMSSLTIYFVCFRRRDRHAIVLALRNGLRHVEQQGWILLAGRYADRGCCQSCGHLRAGEFQQRCPECGAPFACEDAA